MPRGQPVVAAKRRLRPAGVLLAFLLGSASLELMAGPDHWVTTWGCGPQLTEPANLPPVPLANSTLRQFFQASIGGNHLRVRFSNVFGAQAVMMQAVHFALAAGSGSGGGGGSGGNGEINPATDIALTFGGSSVITIPAGETVFSDPVDASLPTLGKFAITIGFGEVPAATITGHPGSRTTSFIASGAAVAAASLPGAARTAHWYFVTGLEVLADSASQAVMVLGDSITDGRGSTTDGNNRWPDDLARRLQTNTPTAGVAVVNMGIGGNGIFSGLGPAAVKRFDRDVLSQSGARWLIVFEGVNDIGGDRQGTIATNLIAAYTRFIAQAHARNLLAYGATITPFGGNHYFTVDHEAERQAVNAWIRTNNLYDGVIDFDAVVRDPAHSTHLLAADNSGDGLHLNPAGYQAMADAINLAWFSRQPNEPVSASASPPAQSAAGDFDDHQNMMDQLGVKALRRGPDPNNQATFDEATANPYTNSLPDVLRMNDGTRVTRADQWPARRAEIQEDFEREVYGRIPANTPAVTWEVTATKLGTNGEIPTVTRTLVGHVDNRGDTNITVNIQASFTVPANPTAPVPVMIEFGGGFGFDGPRGRGAASISGIRTNAPGTNVAGAGPARRGGSGGFGGEPAWHALAITHGWGYGQIVPASIQADNNHLTAGIIGLANQGRPRKPDDWGALRAWQWGVSRLIDYFAANPDARVDATKVGIEGLSRYGKAAIVTEAFEPRIAVGLIGSSGEGGVKLHRHLFGEGVENLAGGEYYWMAGNFIKYGASEPLKTAADLPVDAHELIALCAPRPCFISYGVVEHGDAKWVDAHGSFMAGVLAGPVYQLLGKQDFGTPGNYLTDPMPPVNQLIGGDLAWRQHDGGHDVTPNWPAFFQWVTAYVKAPPLPVPVTGTSGPSH